MLIVRDDGRGIDWHGLERAACEQGPGPQFDAEPMREELAFIEGLSSRSEVSATSGRGVGLSAVREALRKVGGDITAIAKPPADWSTQFEWRLPMNRSMPSNTAIEA